MQPGARNPVGVRTCAGLALLVAAASAYGAVFGAGYRDDDFSLLALVRLLDDPWWLFVQNHMLSMPYYRPVGVAFWWLAEALVGNEASRQYAVNLALHAAIVLVLWRFLVDLTRREGLGFCVALLFAVHPAAIGTALWLSDRFDLLATLFGLLALRAAWRYRERGRRAAFAAVLAWFLLALLSKEVAFALLPALAIVCAGSGGVARTPVARLRILTALCVPAVAVLAMRWQVLGTLGGGRLLERAGAPYEVFARGLASWFSAWPDYLVFPHWLGSTGAILAAAGGVVLLVSIARAAHPRDRAAPGGSGWPVAWLGLALLVGPAFVQWPMIGALAVREVTPDGVVPALADSRYYHLSLVGALVLLAVALDRGSRNRATPAPYLGVLLLAVPLAVVSAHLAVAWRIGTAPLAALVAAANEAIERLPLPRAGCRIYLLGTDDIAFGPYADAIVKATHADEAAVANCLVQAEYAPWHYLIPAARAESGRFAPLVELRNGQTRVPWPRVGNVTVAYLDLPDGELPPPGADTWFLEWRAGAFADVTAAVRSGARRVRVRCHRSPAQCP